MNDEPIGAILVRATDLLEVHSLLREIREQNWAMMRDRQRDAEVMDALHARQEVRIVRLEKRVRLLTMALVIVAVVGFASGWKWRGEQVQQAPQGYAPTPAP